MSTLWNRLTGSVWNIMGASSNGNNTDTKEIPAVAVPLYIYPENDSWEPLHAAMAAHPSLRFHVIVNPYNGPGGAVPDENYIAEVARLNTMPNATLFGYVHVGWGKREIKSALADISTWADWAKYKDADIHVDGIFVDEAPRDASLLQYMRRVKQHTSRAFSGNVIVWTNPGVPVDAAFYEEADIVNAIEESHDNWQTQPGLFTVPDELRHKSTAMVHTFKGSPEQLLDDTQKLRGTGYCSVLITTDSEYTAFGRLWTEFVASVDPA